MNSRPARRQAPRRVTARTTGLPLPAAAIAVMSGYAPFSAGGNLSPSRTPCQRLRRLYHRSVERRAGHYDGEPVRYPVEQFSDEERRLLAPHVTNLDRPVFALVNLPETVKGALFARYSRYPGTLRRLYLEEFAAEVPEGGRPFEGEEGERAAGLYERVFLGYGDDSIAQVGGAHLACEWVSNILTKLLQRGRLAAYLEQSTRYIPYDTPIDGEACWSGTFPLLPRRRARPGVRGSDGRAVRHLLPLARDGHGLGGRALAAGGRGAREGLAELDPGQGAGPPARPAARGHAQPRRHLRVGPGLRADAAADDGLAASRGARVRDDDPGGAEEGDAELRLASRAARPRRRSGSATWRRAARQPSAGSRAWGWTSPPAPTRPRSSWSASRVARRSCWPRRCTSRRRFRTARFWTGCAPCLRTSAPT